MTPAYSITANGGTITDAVRPYLVSMTITDKPGVVSDECTITLDDTAGVLAVPEVGAILRVSIGWQGSALVYKGAYTVDEISLRGPPDTIEISAKAADFTGPLKAQRDLSYDGQTLGSILTTIASRNALDPTIDPGLAAQTIAHIDQTGESDGNFVVRLGKQYDAAATIKDGRLLFMPVGSDSTIGGGAIPMSVIARSETSSHTFTASKREASFVKVRARWRDHGKGETVFAEAQREGTGQTKTLPTTYPTRLEAETAAKSALARLARGECKLTLSLTRGNPGVVANGRLLVSGFRAEIAAPSWTIDEVTHSLSNSGYMTSISATSEPVKASSQAAFESADDDDDDSDE